ncbi:MAG TPA: glycoside hydrolase family 3 C-terminal domain-containing protein [Acidobacteriaceae bacterium]|jgi:beta-glucosidase|nr:glycoside hydrolase family 3 C-terminal domain-containing protein [Acidobacteriaceae bacterium]
MRIQSIHVLVSLLGCALAPPAMAQAPVPNSPAIEQQADSMVAKLTLQQKLEIIGGVDSMFIRAEPSAGFPRLKMSDGPEGVRTWGPDTAYAGGIALAAAWDPHLAHEMGVSIARDARSRSVHFILGPGVNIYRAPMGGRNFEYFGEDPYLSGQTAAAYIRGVQSEGVIATVKHFVANNEEYDRHNVSSDMDERTLREIYLPAFEAAVKEGGVGAVMNSYNLLNGVHATQNKHLNLDILKGDWRFNGILMSDWDATYSAVGAANNGLDLEMPSGKFMNPANLMSAVKSGQVSEATIDEKVRRIFRTAIRFGFLDRDQTEPEIPRFSQEGRHVALQEALESVTLLKNEGNLLPLDPGKIHTIAVLGPDAWPAVPGAGGSSQVDAFQPISIMTGLSNALAGKAKVLYAAGLPTADELFSQTEFYDASGKPPADSGTGRQVKVETFDNPHLSGTPTVTTTRRIDLFRAGYWTPSHQHPSIRYTAQFMPTKTEDYLFLAAAEGSDAYKLIVDGKTVIDQSPHEGQAPRYVEIPLTAGKAASIELDYWPAYGSPYIGLGIRGVEELVSPEAKKIASIADAAVVAVGFDPSTESEGMDRTFTLPFGQDQLIEAVAKANPHTIVDITAGGNVDMHRWLDSIPALLHNWYPGQEGGRALAEILLGEHDPEGHLPVSFERSWDENPTHDTYYPAPGAKGQTPHVFYKEGVFLGYRYYTTYDKKPLFPFGFGLSYTTFSFSHLTVSPEQAGPDAPITVSFDVTNSGQHEGATVAQIYVGDPSAKVKRPVKELKGFEKVRLNPGDTRHLSITLNRRSLAWWSDDKKDWEVDPGKFVVFVGDSSENTPLTQDFQVR